MRIPESHRWLHVLAACAAAAAVVGFFTGTRGAPVPRGFGTAAGEPPPAERPPAPRYGDLRQRHGGNRLRHVLALAALAENRPPLTDPVELDEEARRAALARRAERRAYEGAPPRIPHPIAQIHPQVCVTCHEQGLEVAGRIAPPMSHELHASCTQCHVTMDGPMPGDPLAAGPPVENSFEGMGPPGDGPRAWPGAPPQIPHRTFMRERCESCHGVWALAVPTTHPWRQSCTQCHAPSALLDQRPIGLPQGATP